MDIEHLIFGLLIILLYIMILYILLYLYFLFKKVKIARKNLLERIGYSNDKYPITLYSDYDFNRMKQKRKMIYGFIVFSNNELKVYAKEIYQHQFDFKFSIRDDILIKFNRKKMKCYWNGVSIFYNFTTWIELEEDNNIFHIRNADIYRTSFSINSKTKKLYKEIKEWQRNPYKNRSERFIHR